MLEVPARQRSTPSVQPSTPTAEPPPQPSADAARPPQPPQSGKQCGVESNQAAKLIERVRTWIADPLPCSVFGGPIAGVLSIGNFAGMLKQKVLSTLRNVDSGAMRLESDQYVDGTWITIANALTPRRVELLTDVTHDFLSVSHQLAAAESVLGYLITGEVEERAHHEVTATDWLRLFVHKQALTGGL